MTILINDSTERRAPEAGDCKFLKILEKNDMNILFVLLASLFMGGFILFKHIVRDEKKQQKRRDLEVVATKLWSGHNRVQCCLRNSRISHYSKMGTDFFCIFFVER